MENISVKNVKVNEELSEETICFSADLYEDGKLVAHISNRGIGGSNEVYPAKGLTYKDVAKFDNLDAECEIFDLVIERDFITKNQTKAFVLKKDGKYFYLKNKTSFAKLKKLPKYDNWLKIQLNKLEMEGYTVLNTNL